ncbi:hypothetical protein ACJX0J_001213 (mitochondrion) [Zea mays]
MNLVILGTWYGVYRPIQYVISETIYRLETGISWTGRESSFNPISVYPLSVLYLDLLTYLPYPSKDSAYAREQKELRQDMRVAYQVVPPEESKVRRKTKGYIGTDLGGDDPIESIEFVPALPTAFAHAPTTTYAAIQPPIDGNGASPAAIEKKSYGLQPTDEESASLAKGYGLKAGINLLPCKCGAMEIGKILDKEEYSTVEIIDWVKLCIPLQGPIARHSFSSEISGQEKSLGNGEALELPMDKLIWD